MTVLPIPSVHDWSTLTGILCQISCRTFHISVWSVLLLLFLSVSRQSQMASMGLKSGLWGSHSNTWSTPAVTLFSKYCFTIFEVCFASLSCWKMNYILIKQFLREIAWCCSICLYISFASVPLVLTSFHPHQAEIQPWTVTEHPGLYLSANNARRNVSQVFSGRTAIS